MVGMIESDSGSILVVYDGNVDAINILPYPSVVFDLGGVNDARQIVGSYRDGLGRVRGFIRDANGGVRTYNYPGASDTTFDGINNVGQIVGSVRIELPRDEHGAYRESTLGL